MNLIASFIFVLASFFMFSFHEQDVIVQDELEAALEQVPVPDMSVSILDASEEEQLVWLTEIYRFEEGILRAVPRD